ncbi:uncharacterized protein LOC129590028 [Paramacrobiotus metropolitanus]|uniref:uncharacterized protein LOC129590028 n=1 Tax=Paramacrobiotus metropolitanus TaxID=2943436 RepID=UPI002445E93E|nr:uncharacterized protein LOC129590028 [Paramacrobiotus metropolitanus]
METFMRICFFVICGFLKLNDATESEEVCSSIKRGCDDLENALNISHHWPYTPNFLDEIRENDLLCSHANTTLNCIRQLRSRCPVYVREKLHSTAYGFYREAAKESLIKLCTVTSAIRIRNAKMHCNNQMQTSNFVVQQVLGPLTFETIVSTAITESTAVAAVCRVNRDYLTAVDTDARVAANLLSHCGSEALNVIKAGVAKVLLITPCPADP